jgi:hypothetical protein
MGMECATSLPAVLIRPSAAFASRRPWRRQREDLRVVFELSDASGASKAAIYVTYSRGLLFEQSAWGDATPLLDWLKAHPAACLNSESRLR